MGIESGSNQGEVEGREVDSSGDEGGQSLAEHERNGDQLEANATIDNEGERKQIEGKDDTIGAPKETSQLDGNDKIEETSRTVHTVEPANEQSDLDQENTIENSSGVNSLSEKEANDPLDDVNTIEGDKPDVKSSKTDDSLEPDHTIGDSKDSKIEGTKEDENPEVSKESDSKTTPDPEKQEETKPESTETDSEGEALVYTQTDIDNLKDTENFKPSAIEHIFDGSINSNGNATGYHYEGVEGSAGSTVEGTKTAPDEKGVYAANVEVSGIAKSGNEGVSSFFPADMSPQEVVNAINEAYDSRTHVSGNTYVGETNNGMEITMYLDGNDKIISAYPIYGGDE